jgi:hypothetical protein
LVEARLALQAEDADRLEDAQSAERIRIRRVLGLFERDRDVTLRGEVVDFVWLHRLEDAQHAAGIGHVAVVQDEPPIGDMRILVEVIDALGVEERRAPLHAVHHIALVEQQLGQVAPSWPVIPVINAVRFIGYRPVGSSISAARWNS